MTPPPSPSAARVSEILAAALTGAGISQRQAADATGIPLTTLRRRLSGQSPLHIDELETLGRLVNLTPLDIIERANQAVA